MDLAWTKSTDQTLVELTVTATEGLSDDEVEKRREEHGWNGEQTLYIDDSY